MAEVNRRRCYNDVLPFTVMVAMESINVGLNTVFKAASNEGLSHYVFVTYSFSIAALILLPSLLYRRPGLPPISVLIIGKIFVTSLIGSLSLLMSYKGISYSSPTLASAMSNLIPAFTFIFAIIFRMEKLDWRSFSSQANVLGTVISISGALIIVLYKGPAVPLFQLNSAPAIRISHDSLQSTWATGGLLLACEYILIPIRYILLTHIISGHPAELVVVCVYCLFAALISGAVSYVFETNTNAWILKSNISLIAVLYSGLLGSLLANVVHTWILHHKGPVYMAMFRPMSIAIAAATGVVFLHDTLHLGGIIGGAIISLGFYALMWGKATEEMLKDFVATDIESSSDQAPLLLHKRDDNHGVKIYFLRSRISISLVFFTVFEVEL